MNAQQLTLSRLTVADVQHFFDQPSLTQGTRWRYRSELLPYLYWLYARRSIEFLPDQLRLRHRVRLPKLACDFLSTLESTRRPWTCRGYRGSLAHFHRWLDKEGLALHKLTRPAMSRWCHRLLEDGLHPSSRTHRLFDVRAYLRWLAEQGVLSADPDDLIRRSDFPKLPSYLPRPLPPDVDRELQRRLAASEDLYHRGLLLMRNTGIRIGELAAIEHDCLRIDPNGVPFSRFPSASFTTSASFRSTLPPTSSSPLFNVAVPLCAAGCSKIRPVTGLATGSTAVPCTERARGSTSPSRSPRTASGIPTPRVSSPAA